MMNCDKELVWTFFKTFSRFEYALKESRFAHRSSRDTVAADWDKFENALAKLAPTDLEPVLACGAYLIEKPPKKQILDEDENLDWADGTTTGAEIKKLLVYVRRVRNNLFHGGKFYPGSERDTNLIHSSLLVLQAVLDLPGLPAGVRDTFLEC